MPNRRVVFFDDNTDRIDTALVDGIETDCYAEIELIDSLDILDSYIRQNSKDYIVILMDYDLSNSQNDIYECLERVRDYSRLIPIILFSAQGDKVDHATDLLVHDIYSYIPKAASIIQVTETVNRAFRSCENSILEALEAYLGRYTSEELRQMKVRIADDKILSLEDISHQVSAQTQIGKLFEKMVVQASINRMIE